MAGEMKKEKEKGKVSKRISFDTYAKQHAAKSPCLSRWERWPANNWPEREMFCPLSQKSEIFASSPMGRAKWMCYFVWLGSFCEGVGTKKPGRVGYAPRKAFTA